MLRLCPGCAESCAGLAQVLHQTPAPDDDAIPSTPGWIVATAKVVLLALLLPVLYFVFVSIFSGRSSIVP